MIHGKYSTATAGCDCTLCRAARREYMANYRRQKAYGRWQGMVDADPVRVHVRSLMAVGEPWQGIADRAGVGKGVVSKLLYGNDRTGPTVKMRPANAAKLLALTPAPPPPRIVDSTGSRRRVQALARLGWTQTEQARQLGLSVFALNMSIDRPRLRAGTAEAIGMLYDRLSMAPLPTGWPAERERRRAAKLGWPSPLAWDDETIDDPGAEPAHDAPNDPAAVSEVVVAQACSGDYPWRQLTAEERIAAYAVLRERGWSTSRISRHFGISGSTAQALHSGEPQPPTGRAA